MINAAVSTLALLAAFAGTSVSALAQAAAPAQERPRESAITVVATGTEISVTQTGQSIGVIGPEEIARVQGPDITRALERLPGIVFARSGPPGGTVSAFVRGAASEQLLVLIDGARVNDVAAPAGGFDFGGLSLRGIGRIELLRGSNSVVWGSEAMGGVLAMTSRELHGVEATAEYGARDSFDAQVDAGFVGERHSLALNAGHGRSDGFSSAATGTERDGFRQWRLGGRGRVDLAAGLAATLAGRYARTRVDLDGYPAPRFVFADTDEYQRTREGSGRAGLEYRGDRLDVDAGLALSELRRANYDPAFGPAPGFSSRGRRTRADLKGAWRLAGPLRLDFGADHEWSRFATAGAAAERARIASAHALLGWYAEGAAFAAGVRLDDHSRFGSAWTFGANGSVALAAGWRLRASYGEGFKAPTLYQLFSEYGNLALAPERSRSYDVAIEKGDRNAPLHLAVTGFRRDSRNLIDFASCFGQAGQGLCADGRFGYYANLGRTRAQGVEIELGARASERLHAQAAYTYLEAENRTRGSANRGNALARRPRHALNLSADWATPFHGLALGADVRLVGDRFDDAANAARLDGYVVATLRASLPVSDALELYGRVENLADADHQTVGGYGAAGRSAFVGARARF